MISFSLRQHKKIYKVLTLIWSPEVTGTNFFNWQRMNLKTKPITSILQGALEVRLYFNFSSLLQPFLGVFKTVLLLESSARAATALAGENRLLLSEKYQWSQEVYRSHKSWVHQSLFSLSMNNCHPLIFCNVANILGYLLCSTREVSF